MRCELERDAAATSSTEFVEADLEKGEKGQAAAAAAAAAGASTSLFPFFRSLYELTHLIRQDRLGTNRSFAKTGSGQTREKGSVSNDET
jgi:hypothetical protein